jgi:predicted alpha/beta-hydrolase family hydrolase
MWHLRSGRFAALLVAAVLAAVPAAGGGEPAEADQVVRIPVGTASLEATLHRPAKPNGCAVVVAPGQSGGRERPLPKRTAEALAAAGFTVLRLDWRFFSAKGAPSEDFSAEAADLDAAIGHARSLPGVKKILVAGKSLGTLATAARLAAKPDDVAGLLMLTPALVQDDAGTPFVGIERLFQTRIPTLMVAGDHDPLCPLSVLYRLAEKATVAPRIVVVPGDHGLSKARGDDSETDDNVALAVSAIVLWARRMAGP